MTVQSPVLSLAVHPVHGNWVAAAAMDGTCVIIDALEKRVIQSFKHHSKYASRVAFSNSGIFMVTAGYDWAVTVYALDETTNFVQIHSMTFLGAIESLVFLSAKMGTNEGPADETFVVGCRNDSEKESLHQACLALTPGIPQEDSPVHVHRWFPSYGCALLLEHVCEGMLGVKLLFPDNWAHKSKRIGTGKRVKYSIPHSHEVIFFASADSDLFASETPFKRNKFDEALDKALQNADKRTGGRQIAAGGLQWNQKTPALIAALVRQVLASEKGENLPAGGTTDVGLHTGGRPRCTSWPLVFHLKLLIKSTSLFNRYISEFHLKNLQVEIDRVQELAKQCKLTPTDIDEAFAVLNLAADAVQKTAAESKVHIAEAAFRSVADAFSSSVADNPTSYRAVCIDPEPVKFQAKPLVNMAATIQRLITCFDANKDEPNADYDYPSLLLWVEQSLASVDGVPRATALILVLQTVESFMWKQACLLKPEHEFFWQSGHLDKIISLQHPLLNKYRIPLDASQLEVLVIKDLDALDAMVLVRGFSDQSSKGTDMTIFSLDEMGVCRGSDPMRSRYLNEISNAEKRKNTHWEQVVIKQKETAILRAQLEILNREREDLRNQVSLSQSKMWSHSRHKEEVYRALELVYNADNYRLQMKESEVASKKQLIERTIAPPPFVKNPLPKERDQATTIIFFAEMPKELNNTTIYLISHAQSSFGLSKSNSHTHGTSWRSLYQSVGGSSTFFESFLQPHAAGVKIPNSFGEQDVDHISDSASCVWHPTHSRNGLSYTSLMNPWDVQKSGLWCAFVEKLQPNFESLQWAIDAPSMNVKMDPRGNQIFAEFSEKPENFSRMGFEAFGKLRAYPHLQIRHFINHIFRENLMPLDDNLTVTIVRRGIKNPGTALEGGLGFWRCQRLRPTPRRYKDLMLLGDLAGFLAQYGKQYSDTSFQFSDIAEDWANDLQTELSQNSMGNSNEENIQLKAKECLMIGYAIICLSHVDTLDEDEVGRLCKLSARFTFGLVFVIPSYNIPQTAVWTSSKSNCCFDSTVGDHLFSINVITGCVLVDGLPPGRLPASILYHELYKTHFGNRDFQIQPFGSSFMTVDPLNGYFYKFALNESKLIVLERNITENLTLQLLDFSVAKCSLRKEKTGFFAVGIHDLHLSFGTLHERTHAMDQFIHLEGEDICNAVSRLEDPASLHTLLSPKNEVVISLPRFRLSFTQSGKTLLWMSQQHKGFRLRYNQKLDDAALPFFKQYLIFEHPQLKKIQVWVPMGRLAKTEDGFTEIVLSKASNVILKAATYELHPITKLLRCAKCWLNKPLGKRKVDALEDTMAFSFREPAVGVLCSHIKFSASQLEFLFPEGIGGAATEFSKDFLKAAVASCTQLAKSRPSEENTGRSLTNFELTPFFGQLPYSHIEDKYDDLCVDVKGMKIATEGVALMEKAYVDCLSWAQRSASGFPLVLKEEAGKIEKLLNAELEDSWKAHIILKKPHLREERFANLSALLSQQLPLSTRCQITRFPIFYAFHSIRGIRSTPSDASLQNIVDAVLVLLELHVIHTRIERLQRAVASKSYEALVKDIFVRKWSIREFPKWLVFEVEGGLQIRPNQYATALQMMDKPSSIVQLNMGEGKTRVIMPRIPLAHSSKSLPRVTVLTPLLNEVFGHMHSTLTASILSPHILQLPFHRQITLDQMKVRKMIEFAKLVRSEVGFLVKTPDYQLPLNLKLQEVQISGDPINDSLPSFFSTFQFQDIVDESGAVLSHRYQLVYAVGNHTSLSDGSSRWCIAHVILDLLNTNPVLQNLLSSKFVMRDNTVSKSHFQCLRLAPRINDNEEQKQFLAELSNRVVQALVSQTTLQSLLSLRQLLQLQQARILMLRGLLAFGLLEHCLSLRHAVDYGLDTRRQKRMAVPFTAVSVPSERAEFSSGHCHPVDVPSILSCKGSQEYYHTRWFECVQSELTEDEADSIGKVEKIDLTNSSKVELLCRTFSKSTKHYSKHIGSSAWNLSSGSHVVLFSGTNDNAIMLPTQVSQVPSDDKSLRGTNGMMIERIISKTKNVVFFPAKSIWDQLASYSLTTESQSSIPANMCFVIFDDARTRGVDKKLAPDALALVTLGPKLKKDKLMQGAGRMRQLDAGQRLAFCGTTEVEQNIHGLLQWADQGIHFESCRLNQSKADEEWGLKSLYAAIDSKTHLPSHVEACIQSRVGESSDLCDAVAKRTRELGQQIEVQVKHDQECERELQQEKEKESETEAQIPSQEAVLEPSWTYKSVLTMQAFQPPGFPTPVLPLKQAASLIVDLPDLKRAEWSIANVWATQNFCTTVLCQGANYLRSVDCMLYFPTSEHLLLLSEKEADGILREIWNCTNQKSIHVTLIHLSQLRTVVHESPIASIQHKKLQLSAGDTMQVPRWEETAIAQVFSGDSNVTPAAEVGEREEYIPTCH
ncbi:hypothetical protein BJ741DRAFT_647146 [Chytriomyces cf. hyalinus JEL632]|nr:hypothetical protein BJ741DRAFT_647146 [Chytriomyces cf. hyalinus JEL632]